MKNDQYWTQRSGKQLLSLLKNGEKLHKRLKSDYSTAQRNILKEIEALYGRFAVDNAISQADALNVIKGDEFRHWRMSMEEYLEEIETSGNQVLLFELNTLAMRSRINRLEAIEGEILAQMAKLAKTQDKAIGEHLEASLADTYYKGMYERYRYGDRAVFDLMKNHNVAISKSNITKALTLPWSGGNYSKNIWKREFNVATRAREMVTRNILEGKSLEALSQELADLLGSDYKHAARRLILTETAYAKGQGDLLTYEKLGVEEYEYLATLDNQTSDVCQELDGKHFPAADAKPGVNYPPMHPHCRSTTIIYREDKDKDDIRVARNEAGEVYKVPADLTYKEWKKSVEGYTGSQVDEENSMLDGVPVIRADGDIKTWLDSAKAVARNYGADVSEVTFSSKPDSEMPSGAQAYCLISWDKPGIIDYTELVLMSDDRRPYEYRIKTAFHEAYHLGSNGKPHDIDWGMSEWLDMEETFAEASAHYLIREAGVPGFVAPAYSEKLVKILPRLKRLDKYGDCKNLFDFGKIAAEERAGGGSAEWRDLHAKVMSIELEKDYYLPYADFINKNKTDVVQKLAYNFLNNQGAEMDSLKQRIHKDLDEAVRLIENGENADNASTNTQTVYSQAIAYAFNKMGVL